MTSSGELFVSKWHINAEDLLQKDIYEKACEMLEPYEKVLEVGCGTGHSTLALLLNNHRVFAIDIFAECIDKTAELVSYIGYEIVDKIKWSAEDATLMRANLFDPEVVDGIMRLDVDAIIIWNPGQMDKVKIVDQCAILASAKGIPLQVMEREASEDDADNCLKEIATDNALRLIHHSIIPVEWNQKEGIRLQGTENDTIYEAIGVYFP